MPSTLRQMAEQANLSQQSNFYRQIRNFNIDISASTTDAMAGLHWQVGQATSLMYIAIFGSKKAGNNQRLMFTENGSSGFMVSSNTHISIFSQASNEAHYHLARIKLKARAFCAPHDR